uniref:Immunoglobulin domain-containing protein n=1 Tax=Moschus moschiferus TaxID=68415 RepID=A0A8C6FWM4_MOSMO
GPLNVISITRGEQERVPPLLAEYEKPSLSAWPSPVVPFGQTVTLRCHSSPPFVIFRLSKRDGTRLPELQGHHFNTYTLGPVTRDHAGSYTCSGVYRSLLMWSDVSDPLQIVVTGVFPKPAISAHPGPLVRAGENVTLRCHSSVLFDKFILHKKESIGHFQRHAETFTGGHAPADFSIGPMTASSAGTYRCYGSLSRSPYEWSAPSDPVDIVTTGLSKKPSLSAQGGPVVRSGENVTLLCSSESACDQFHLLREGRNLGHPLAGGRGPRGASHSGVYRCYGSFARSPDSWSDPSGPLFLSVARNASNSQPLHAKPNPNSGNPRHLHALIGPSVAFVFLVSLISFLVHHWCPDGKGKSQEEEASDPDTEELDEVTYTDLDCSVFTRKIITPTSQRPREPSADASVYMDLMPTHKTIECYL